MKKNEVIDIVVSKLPLLSFGADQMPTEADVRLWLGGAMHHKTVGGHAAFYVNAPRGATPEVKCLLRVMQWHRSAGGLHGLMGARMMVSREVFPKIETLGTLVAVLSGRTPAVDRWNAVLHRPEATAVRGGAE